jgi:hypothetical protein
VFLKKKAADEKSENLIKKFPWENFRSPVFFKKKAVPGRKGRTEIFSGRKGRTENAVEKFFGKGGKGKGGGEKRRKERRERERERV